MRYLRSVVINPLSKTSISTDQVRKIRNWGLIVYSAIIFVLYCYMLIKFPGYVHDGSLVQYQDWFLSTQYRIKIATLILWISMSFISTIITIYAIRKMFRIIDMLQKFNKNVDHNSRTVKIHSCLLITQTLIQILVILENTFF